MKMPFTTLMLLAAISFGSAAQAQVTAAETQALSKQLAQLMRNPKKPKQDVHLMLNGCQAQQIIRDRDADVQMNNPLAVSYGGNSGWAVKVDNGVFEMKMGLNWADVTSLTYEPGSDSDARSITRSKSPRLRRATTAASSFRSTPPTKRP